MLKPYYDRDGIQIFLGDCLQIMPQLDRKFDLTLTDYPYGIGEKYQSFDDTQENIIRLINNTMPFILKISNSSIISTGTKNMFLYPKPKWVLCWYNPAGAYPGPWGFTTWHPMLCYGSDPYLRDGLGSMPDSIKNTTQSEKNGHPCPKPIAVWKWLLNRGTTREGQSVLDPFLGSGTTLVAAAELHRQAVGIEIEEKYCEISAKRIERVLNQGELF